MSVSLRAATEADAPRLREIVRAAYGIYVERIGREPRPMTEDYAEVIRASDVYAAESRGETVGLVVLIPGDEEGFLLDNVAVDPSRKGTGVGRTLLEHAEAKAREAGADSVYLYTHEKMTENLALYERIGYVEYERRQQDSGDHIVYMRKQLA
jgi:N-acetylglutamate synthase-like GNAT family acetyltransferase